MNKTKPTEKGLMAQLMRHNEEMAKTSNDAMEAIVKATEKAQKENEKLKKENAELRRKACRK